MLMLISFIISLIYHIFFLSEKTLKFAVDHAYACMIIILISTAVFTFILLLIGIIKTNKDNQNMIKFWKVAEIFWILIAFLGIIVGINKYIENFDPYFLKKESMKQLSNFLKSKRNRSIENVIEKSKSFIPIICKVQNGKMIFPKSTDGCELLKECQSIDINFDNYDNLYNRIYDYINESKALLSVEFMFFGDSKSKDSIIDSVRDKLDRDYVDNNQIKQYLLNRSNCEEGVNVSYLCSIISKANFSTVGYKNVNDYDLQILRNYFKLFPFSLNNYSNEKKENTLLQVQNGLSECQELKKHITTIEKEIQELNKISLSAISNQKEQIPAFIIYFNKFFFVFLGIAFGIRFSKTFASFRL